MWYHTVTWVIIMLHREVSVSVSASSFLDSFTENMWKAVSQVSGTFLWEQILQDPCISQKHSKMSLQIEASLKDSACYYCFSGWSTGGRCCWRCVSQQLMPSSGSSRTSRTRSFSFSLISCLLCQSMQTYNNALNCLQQQLVRWPR